MNKGHLPSDQIITISLASLPKVVALFQKVDDDDDDDGDDDYDDDHAKEKPAKHQKKESTPARWWNPVQRLPRTR